MRLKCVSPVSLDVAKYILAHFDSVGSPITNLKLQKLVYYSQAWALAIHDEPLFTEEIEAWVHGPVTPSVFKEYREFRWNPITGSFDNQVSSKKAKHIDSVLEVYGNLDAGALERLTHSERPWLDARGNLPPDVSSHAIITQSSMKAFYKTRLADG